MCVTCRLTQMEWNHLKSTMTVVDAFCNTWVLSFLLNFLQYHIGGILVISVNHQIENKNSCFAYFECIQYSLLWKIINQLKHCVGNLSILCPAETLLISRLFGVQAQMLSKFIRHLKVSGANMYLNKCICFLIFLNKFCFLW